MGLQFLKKGILMVMLLNTLNGYSQSGDVDRASALQLNATYKGDFVSNLHGGITTGSTYLGLADLFIRINTEKAGLWKGGEFLIRGANSHGGEPSAFLVGDFQGITNIEAGNHTFLYELWFKQSIWNVTATIGLQDMNAEFANSEVSAFFLNSSFGIHSVIADNISVPIFPITKPGITFCGNITRKLTLKTAIYKGCPVDFDTNPYNLDWDVNYEKGFLGITEGQYSWTGIQEKSNVLKGGIFFHQHCEESNMDHPEMENNLSFDYGFYLVGEHEVFSNSDKSRTFKVFYQLGLSPRNDNFGYFGTGCTYSGWLSSDGTDILGLAVADGLFNDAYGKDETTFELSYKVQLSHQIYLQPDLQYVVHPGGSDAQLKNATVGLMRLGMEF
jgi:porin